MLDEINGHTLISDASSGRHQQIFPLLRALATLPLPPLPLLNSSSCSSCLPSAHVLCLGHLCHLTLFARSQSTPMANEAPLAMSRALPHHRIISTRHSAAYENNNCGKPARCAPSSLPPTSVPPSLPAHHCGVPARLVGFIAVLLVENKLITWTSSSN